MAAIGDGDRLDPDLGSVDHGIGRGEQRALEWQDAVPVAARPFREQDEVRAVAQRLAQLVRLLARALNAALDVDRSLQRAERADDGPARNLGLGDEARVHQPAEHRHVEIGGVVADIEDRPAPGGGAGLADVDRQQAAAEPVPEAGQVPHGRKRQPLAEHLEQGKEGRHADKSGGPHGCPQVGGTLDPVRAQGLRPHSAT